MDELTKKNIDNVVYQKKIGKLKVAIGELEMKIQQTKLMNDKLEKLCQELRKKAMQVKEEKDRLEEQERIKQRDINEQFSAKIAQISSRVEQEKVKKEEIYSENNKYISMIDAMLRHNKDRETMCMSTLKDIENKITQIRQKYCTSMRELATGEASKAQQCHPMHVEVMKMEYGLWKIKQ